MTESLPTVIVVDDDLEVREAVESLLRSFGFQVGLYDCAQAFLDSELPRGPCCLVLDIRMPGKSGLELQSELVAAGVTMPIVFMTGHGDVRTSVRAIKAGAVEFLTKPFRDAKLLAAIMAAFDRDRRAPMDGAARIPAGSATRDLTTGELDIMADMLAALVDGETDAVTTPD